ncbi:MAG: LPS export ABC transporter permease LptF [Oxalobacter sp.]|nr:MAG: LPS export ABC transporter permease LptF [Oxalobacter sp.]
MIFHRALRRELVGTGGAVFMTLFSITITVMLIRILGQAALGKIASEDVVAFIGFAAINYLPVILVLTGFITVLMVITRCYQDSEMVVWFASGQSLTQWIRPVLLFGLPIILLTSALSFTITPWANRQSAEFRERFEKRSDVSKVAPGTFQESAGANRVFFVEGISGDLSQLKNVFVHTVKNTLTSVVVAKRGTIETDAAGDKYLVMEDGMRYESRLEQADMQFTHFERYMAYIASDVQVIEGDKTSRAKPLLELIRDPSRGHLGELLWRLALPLMSLLLMLLAIPLGFVNPRAGRSANLLIALLLYVTYSNMVSYLQAAVTRGKMKFALAWWPLHVVIALIVLALFLMRQNVNSRYHPAVLWSLIRHRKLKAKNPGESSS